ncbi:MAG: hypothetical protein KDA41_20080, partial [Planctomycetales bacterium]|nr:hypothetical protein [Planctomycetales bacterium]
HIRMNQGQSLVKRGRRDEALNKLIEAKTALAQLSADGHADDALMRDLAQTALAVARLRLASRDFDGAAVDLAEAETAFGAFAEDDWSRAGLAKINELKRLLEAARRRSESPPAPSE